MAIYFGGDLSSTSATLKAIDEKSMKVVETFKVSLDDIAHSMDVPTVEGMIEGPGGYFHVPGKVLVAGQQEVMRQAAKDKTFENSEVKAGSWSVQGHLGVYLRNGIVDVLRTARDGDLAALTEPFFTCDCPTWRDSSTKKEVEQLNRAMQQAGINVINMAERYPGAQILKRVDTAAYNDADIIMVGNALASFLITGVPTFSGPGDAAASGFVNLKTLKLDRRAMDVISTDLHNKVAEVTSAGGFIGKANPFYRAMGYTNLKMFVGDQDNIKSAAYLIFDPAVLQVSLGTSYTVSVVANAPIKGFEGNFASNDAKFPYLLLLCKNNGSSSVSGVLKAFGHKPDDFDKISTALKRSPVGNDRAMALPYYDQEIIPYHEAVKDMIRTGYGGCATFNQDMRAAIEGNAASMKRWATEYFKSTVGGEFKALSFAGGATNNKDLVKVWVNMFGIPAYSMAQAEDAAAVGAGLTAMADSDGRKTLQSVLPQFLAANKPHITNPGATAAHFYENSFMPAYSQFEDKHIQQRK